MSQICVGVIDDDPLVRTGSSLLLQAWGAEVLESSDFDGFAKVIKEHSGTIDLLLVDVFLNGYQGGTKAVERLARFVARMPRCGKVAVMTGSTEPAVLAEIKKMGWPVLIKPFTPDRLKEFL